MADSITHIASVYLVGRPAEPLRRYSLVLGALAPDIIYKFMLYFLGAPTGICECGHVPAFVPLFAGLFASLFDERKGQAFVWFSAGMFMHILVDMGKSYCGSGVIYLLWPFESRKLELAIYDIHDWRIPVTALVLVVLVEAVAHLLRKQRT